jgi:hypothetical protein
MILRPEFVIPINFPEILLKGIILSEYDWMKVTESSYEEVMKKRCENKLIWYLY